MTKHHFEHAWEHFRLRLAAVDALPQLSLMGLLSGILAGLVMVGFRFLSESLQGLYLPPGEREHYEALDAWVRFVLPLGSALLLVVAGWRLTAAQRSAGIVHVIERLAYHQGRMPWRNALYQFVGGALCIAGGHSVGREGPAVHLGAAGGSLLGQWLRLPHNSLRVLVACGSAAAIGASFNTPLAGVIFAMEVVMMEYSLATFTPVILAAVAGTLVNRAVYGTAPVFALPPLPLDLPLEELFYLVGMGVVIGLLAAAFVHLLDSFTRRWKDYPWWQRIFAAGLCAGMGGVLLPQVMGIGYATVDAALAGQLGLGLMLALVAGKLLLTATVLALGLPGGLIGPTLVMGAAAGGCLGIGAQFLFSDQAASPALYALLGMTAMMSATLQAPLAALTAVLELTANLNVILPGMLVIVIANLIAAAPPWRKASVFLTLLRARGLDYHHDPLSQWLRRAAVTDAMERRVVDLPRRVGAADAAAVMNAETPRWIVLGEEEQQRQYLLAAADLAHFLSTHGQAVEVDLLEVPGQRLQLAPIHFQATLQEAQEVLRDNQAEALYVVRPDAAWPLGRIFGVLTPREMEACYRALRGW